MACQHSVCYIYRQLINISHRRCSRTSVRLLLIQAGGENEDAGDKCFRKCPPKDGGNLQRISRCQGARQRPSDREGGNRPRADGRERSRQIHTDEMSVRRVFKGQRRRISGGQKGRVQELQRGARERRGDGASGVESGTQAQCDGQYVAGAFSADCKLVSAHQREKDV